MIKNYNLYIDMDGVLADFDAYVCSQNDGMHPTDTGDSVWDFINIGSFMSFPKMKDANDLWEYVLDYDPIILTATGHSIRTAEEEKKFWAWIHFQTRKIYTVKDGADKINLIYAPNIPTSILVDDRPKAIDPWIEAGGIGILHTSAEDSINQLKIYLET